MEPEKSKFSFEEDDFDVEELLGPYLVPKEDSYGHQQHKDREYKPVGFFFIENRVSLVFQLFVPL